DYKTRWMNRDYNFEYHVYYDSNSLLIKSIAFFISRFFKLKQYLREKDFDFLLGKIKFLIKKQNIAGSNVNFEFTESNHDYNESQLQKINFYDKENYFLKSIIFEFLYLNT